MLEDMIEQAKLIKEGYIKLVKNALKYNLRDNYLVGIYEESANKAKEQTVNTVTTEKIKQKEKSSSRHSTAKCRIDKLQMKNPTA